MTIRYLALLFGLLLFNCALVVAGAVKNKKELAIHRIQPKTYQWTVHDAAIPQRAIQKQKNAHASHFALEAYRVFPSEMHAVSSLADVRDALDFSPPDPVDSIRYFINRANSLFHKVKDDNRFTDIINAQVARDLPIGIRKEIGGIEYIIIIDKIYFERDGAYIDAFMSLEVPNSVNRLTFMGKRIKFSQTAGIEGVATVYLLDDYVVKFNNQSLIRFKKADMASGTVAKWDCFGFKELTIDAEIEFSRDWIRPVDGQGEELSTGRVIASFASTITDWNNLIAEVNIPDFKLSSLQSASFRVERAVFDFSDLQNASTMSFPASYPSDYHAGGANAKLWRGVFLERLSVRLASQFDAKEGGEPTIIQASNVLLDNTGFSGLIQAREVLSIDKGDASGWAFSVDSLSIHLVSNQLVEANFKGAIEVPIAKEQKNFSYSAIIDPENHYYFTIATDESIETNLWAAELTLYESSTLEIGVIDKKFKPRATLHGQMTIDAPLAEGSETKLSLAQIDFEHLQISTEAPYITVGAFAVGSESAQQKLAAFPISISEVGISRSNNVYSLDLRIHVNLSKSEDSGFSAETSVSARASYDPNRQRKLQLEEILINEAIVDVDNGAFALRGSIFIYRDDPTYGKGFQGSIEATFTPGLTVEANAIFGNTGTYRYWYVDALAGFETGIVIFPGFAIYGFGGGAYYHMRQAGFDTSNKTYIGKTTSGIVYEPHEETHLGLKASVNIGTHPSDMAFNGSATFEISFTQSGGIQQASFLGEAFMMTPALDKSIGDLKEKCKALSENLETDESKPLDAANGASIYARLYVLFDNANNTLHGNMDVYVNVAGGAMKGIGENGRAGNMVMHFSPSVWYVYIGNPDDRVGLNMLGLFETGSYMMVGNSIPGSPSPPDKVGAILGRDDLNAMRDLNALGNGAGFAFGSYMAINTGDLNFLMFYAKFAAEVGFDIMLKNYGEGTRCAGSDSPIGINGWYASGQAYAYLEGKIGIRVDLKFYKGSYDILDIGAAALLQAQLPNPVWMRGIVGGSYNILNGLVKGKCDFEVEIGQKCTIVSGSPLGGIAIIAQVTPSQGESEVNVFNKPQAIFNYPVDEVFEFVDLEDTPRAFRIKLEKMQVLNGSAAVLGDLEWSPEKDVVAFRSFEVLPPEKQLKVRAVVSFQEKVNGAWQSVKTTNGAVLYESKEATFTTGPAPDYIPEENVVVQYPLKGQANFYKNEYATGYLQLETGQKYLFEPSAEWKQRVRFTSTNNKVQEVSPSYRESDRKVLFPIPAGLVNGKSYTLQIINVPANKQGAVNANVDSVITKEVDTELIDLEIKTQNAEEALVILEEKQLYKSYFRSSTYSTFRQKYEAITKYSTIKEPIVLRVNKDAQGRVIGFEYLEGVHELLTGMSFTEGFDAYELKGLLEIRDNLANEWFTTYINPLVYAGYPVRNFTIDWRNPNALGIPPAKAIVIANTEAIPAIQEDNLSSYGAPANGTAYLRYQLPLTMFKDYGNMQQKAVNYLATVGYLDWAHRIVFTPFTPVLRGTYTISLRYKLPGNMGYGASSVNQTLNVQ
ncbi:hypothetical protein QWY31_00080 [Cytophagales bacterium LB-30]|uniref:Uncharacterized protein n=1 Tax=Shiella aurantiaca TaxID=3058365 RepID=A0ABT8F0W1_9BACT|nr:hypothetical protein [Shiella aurantiaca]MDN4163871.1 hypothetical protein [Shiella aurantiaca]